MRARFDELVSLRCRLRFRLRYRFLLYRLITLPGLTRRPARPHRQIFYFATDARLFRYRAVIYNVDAACSIDFGADVSDIFAIELIGWQETGCYLIELPLSRFTRRMHETYALPPILYRRAHVADEDAQVDDYLRRH